MLNINTLNYNASATSVNQNDEVVATFYFNADNYSNYSFTIGYKSVEAITDADVQADFAAFKTQIAGAVSDDIAPYATTPAPSEEP